MKYIKDKQDIILIINDISARLMTGIFLSPIRNRSNLSPILLDVEYFKRYSQCEVLESIPILRSMSSITDKEKKELSKLGSGLYFSKDVIKDSIIAVSYNTEAIDYLIKHYLDFRNLIKRGLAKEDNVGLYEKVYNLSL